MRCYHAAPMNKWLHVHPARRQPRLQLICFPHAGGTAGTFRPWAARLPGDVELVAVEPPGRRGRLAERALASLADLVDAIEPVIAPLLDRPFAFFGHSMGAIVAFELVRRLRARGRPLPAVLLVSGARAPQIPRPEPGLRALPDVELVNELAALGGTSREILREPELMQMLLPSLRADLTAVETWRYAEGPPLEVPIFAFGGEGDVKVPREHLDAWAAQTRGECRVRQFPGGHFYLLDHEAALVESVASAL